MRGRSRVTCVDVVNARPRRTWMVVRGIEIARSTHVRPRLHLPAQLRHRKAAFGEDLARRFVCCGLKAIEQLPAYVAEKFQLTCLGPPAADVRAIVTAIDFFVGKDTFEHGGV